MLRWRVLSEPRWRGFKRITGLQDGGELRDVPSGYGQEEADRWHQEFARDHESDKRWGHALDEEELLGSSQQLAHKRVQFAQAHLRSEKCHPEVEIS